MLRAQPADPFRTDGLARFRWDKKNVFFSMSWLRMWSCQCPAVFTVSSRVPFMQLWKLASASAISGERSKKIKFLSPSPWILNGPRGRPEFKHNPLRVTNLPEGHTQDSPGSDFLDVFCWFPISSSVVVLPEKTATWFIALIVWGCCCCFGALILGRLIWSLLGFCGVLIVFPRGFAIIIFPFKDVRFL